VERPLHLGATLAGGAADLLDGLSGYGLPLGEAFQLRDDLLGVYGNPQLTGKPAGDDLREGKRTVLVAYAFEHANHAQSEALRGRLGDPALDDDGVAVLREVIAATGATAYVERLIDERAEAALAALAATPMRDDARAALVELAGAATRRRG
jgi:geranylgeranyl diphosphate synthase type I